MDVRSWYPKPMHAALLSFATIALASCAGPGPRDGSDQRTGGSRVENDGVRHPTCPRCRAEIGGALNEPAPQPAAPGEERLRAFMIELDPGSKRGPRQLGLTVVVGTPRQLLSPKSADLTRALALQRARINQYLAALRGARMDEDELRKQLLAWALCVCPRTRRCQGGEAACVRCSTCRTMSAQHGAARGAGERMPAQRAGAWPRARRGPTAGMGLMAEGCPPKNVCLVIDVSGSMGEEQKLERIKAAVKESLRHYMAGDVFSLIAFNERAQLVIPPTPLEPTAGDLQGMGRSRMPRLMSSPLPVDELIVGDTPMERKIRRFVHAIDRLYPGGATDVDAALRLAVETLQSTSAQRRLLRDPRAINRVLLFSDGMHNAKRADPDVLARFHAFGHDLVARRLSISTFGVGKTGFDERLLCELVRPSLEHSGRYYYVRDPSRVRELLWDDLMTTPMLKDALLIVELSGGASVLDPGPFTAAAGRPTRLQLNLGTLTAEEKRALALRLRGGAGDSATVAVRLVYTDPSGRRRLETARVARALPSSDPAARVALEELALQDVRASFGRAVEHLDQGDRLGAAAELEGALTALAELQRTQQRRP